MHDADTPPLHGGQLRQIAERFGIAPEDLLDFSANINPNGPPPSVLAALRDALDHTSTLRQYPDLEETGLMKSIARYAGVSSGNVIAANGFVPLLDAALQTLKMGSCLLPVPCFVEYRRALERAGINVVRHDLNADCGFRYDVAAMLATRTDAILLANPQNPSGVCHDAAFLRDLVGAAALAGTYVLLDEAFVDYVPEQTLSAMTGQFRNLIVFRSVTKFHAIPALRVAYAIANTTLAATIADRLPPWAITTLASRGVIAALSDDAYAVQSRIDNTAARDWMSKELQALGLTVYASAANFLLFRLPASIEPEVFWQRMIREHRIVLRWCANYEGLAVGHFRAAVQAHAENEKLVAAIALTLARSK